MKKISLVLLSLLLTLTLLLSACSESPLSSFMDDPDDKQIVENQDDKKSPSDTKSQSSKETEGQSQTSTPSTSESVTHTIDGIPAYSGSPNVAINNNVPAFTAEEITTVSYEHYSELDSLGRCGVVMACIGTDLMPTEDREEIGSVKPSGWVNNRYDSDIVSGGYVYNRSHLIGFQLTGENANEKNLITGTRYFNVEGMLPFENYVADYLKEEPEHHVMYRVTPIYIGNNLVASGVQMEAYSVEDEGNGISFNVFIYNVQPGIYIDYATGNNWLDTENPPVVTDTETETTDSAADVVQYILNVLSKKFHDPDCSYADNIGQENRRTYSGTRDALIQLGYAPCGTCDP